MRLDLKEFAKAARSMHQQPGGVKRTRLMLHLRPYKTRKIFVLKATDGRTTLTTRVEHQGQIKQVEALVGDFVSECTKLSVPTATSGNTNTQNTAQSPSALPAGAASSATAAGATSATSPATSGQKESGAGGKAGGAGGSHQTASQPQRQQQQQQQQSGKQGNKGKKGKKH